MALPHSLNLAGVRESGKKQHQGKHCPPTNRAGRSSVPNEKNQPEKMVPIENRSAYLGSVIFVKN
ncbi:MAG: hypothetical protein C4530_18470 [Desulfobacteraceae bacterium]|nr:MAG: hypothetical protein C4530_18470 [Desulfobacteraceae bacterium]